MTTGAPILAPSNDEVRTRELRVSFWELAGPKHGDGDGVDTADESIGTGHHRERFVVREVAAQPDTDREKWVYVFQADLKPDRTVSGTSLQWEGQFDEAGTLRTVRWGGGPGSWATSETPDDRPAVDVVEGNVLTVKLPEGSALGERTDPGVRTVVLAFLSHVQLPHHRLDRYFSNDPEVRLPDRALLLDPDATPEMGGYGMTLGHAGSSQGRWVRPQPDGTVRAYLVDPVDYAFTLHERYTTAADLFDVFALEHAEKLLHASLARALATGYMAQQEAGREEERDEAEQKADVPGTIFKALEAYEETVAAEHERVESWSHHLYDWMSRTMFELARDDASDVGPPSRHEDARLERVEVEIARQAELLRGAERSVRGKGYLVAHLVEAGQGAWYERVALGSRVVARIADVPSIVFERLGEKAAEEVKKVTDEVADLNARRAAIGQRRLGSAADLLMAYEFARGAAPHASARIDGLQARLLDPMLEAVGAGPGGRGMLAPFVDQAAAAAAQQAQSLRTGGGLPALDALDAALRSGTPSGALPVWEVVAPGSAGSLPQVTAQAGLVVTSPSVIASGGIIHGPERVVRYQTPRLEMGLLGLSGTDGGQAMADLRAIAGPSAPSAGATATRGRKRALSRLLDVAGRPVAGTTEGRLYEIRRAVASKQTELTEAQLREHTRTTQINWAGRLFLALNVLDLVTGYVETQAKWADAGRDVGRGAPMWEAYLGVVGAGAGAASAGAGAIESLDSVFPPSWLSGGVGTALKVAAVAGSALAVVAGVASYVQESRTHDTAGKVSAGFAIAAGVAGFASATGLIAWGAAALAIPVAGWIVTAVIFAFAALSLLAHLWADGPIEEWLKNCIWSALEAEEVKDLAPTDPRVRHEVEDLFQMLAAPSVSVELRELVEGAPSRLKRYGAETVPPPDLVRVTVRPGLHPPGTRIELSGFKVLTPFTWGEWIEDLIPFSEGERDELPAQMRGAFPDPQADVVLVHDAHGPAFVREWRSATALPTAFMSPTAMTPRGTDFSCRARVRLPDDVGRVADPVFDLEGAVGFATGTPARVYSTVVSRSTAEAVP